jgi:NitT/TauT family transport system substrate-binding protein
MSVDQSEDRQSTSEATQEPTLSRRTIIQRAGIGAGALALGGSAIAAPALAKSSVFSVIKSRYKVVLNYGGATCEAPTYTAYQKGFYAAEGLDVELYKTTAGYNTSDLLSSGKIDGTQGICFPFFKPIEQGADIRITAGLHGNCLRVVVAKNSGIRKAADFKGKSIGVGSLGDVGMTVFTLLLAENGVDPLRDVNWKVYDPTLFGAALDKGEIQAVAAPDPFAYILVLEGKAIQVGNNVLGLFGNAAGLTPNRYCCGVVLSGKLIRDQPKVAAALTRAWLKSAHYVAGHTHEVSIIETSDGYVTLPQPTVEKLLNSYVWIPSATRIEADIIAGARAFKASGFLDPDTDPNKLAQVTYVNIFKETGEPAPTF